ncbi:MAG: NAD(+) synthase [bacterium]|jgi:NAD+ synthase
MNVATLADKLTGWMKQQIESARANGVVFGLSGGLDSAVVAGLAKRACPGNSLAVIMPCHSISEDAEHGRRVIEHFGLSAYEVVLDKVYDNMVSVLSSVDTTSPKRMAKANLKSRLRMVTLYYLAAQYQYLVVGSSNKSELTVGYFTKYGDVGDILPLANLVKSQVKELACYLEVPEEIIIKPPSAGLWVGQTDEAEMGFGYDELDSFILNGQASPSVAKRILNLKERSQHKRQLAARPDF